MAADRAERKRRMTATSSRSFGDGHRNGEPCQLRPFGNRETRSGRCPSPERSGWGIALEVEENQEHSFALRVRCSRTGAGSA